MVPTYTRVWMRFSYTRTSCCDNAYGYVRSRKRVHHYLLGFGRNFFGPFLCEFLHNTRTRAITEKKNQDNARSSRRFEQCEVVLFSRAMDICWMVVVHVCGVKVRPGDSPSSHLPSPVALACWSTGPGLAARAGGICQHDVPAHDALTIFSVGVDFAGSVAPG